jgi:hypothetical protein
VAEISLRIKLLPSCEGVLEAGQCCADCGRKPVGHGRRDESSPLLLEKRPAQPQAQAPQRVAHGRLADGQDRSRMAYAALPIHHVEYMEQIEVQTGEKRRAMRILHEVASTHRCAQTTTSEQPLTVASSSGSVAQFVVDALTLNHCRLSGTTGRSMYEARPPR